MFGDASKPSEPASKPTVERICITSSDIAAVLSLGMMLQNAQRKLAIRQ